MGKEKLKNIRYRADSKLRYAKIHLDELASIDKLGGDDFDRAHQESFLYHLLGAKEAFIHELNIYYAAEINSKALTPGKLRGVLKNRGIRSRELATLFKLENDTNSWFFHAKEMRDHSTHVSGVLRSFHLDGTIFLKNPTTQKVIPNHFINEFANWHELMSLLLEKLRQSAIKANFPGD